MVARASYLCSRNAAVILDRTETGRKLSTKVERFDVVHDELLASVNNSSDLS